MNTVKIRLRNSFIIVSCAATTGDHVRRQPLTLAEIEILERSATPREQLLLRVIYETGCTISELVHLKTTHIKGGFLRINRRRIKLSLYLLSLIRTFPRSSPFILSTRESPSITARRAEQLLSSLGKRALSMSITPSQLRTTRIIHDFIDRVPLTEIERKTGLKSVQPHIYAYFKSQERGWQR